MKKVITYGTYDLLHQGHINLLRRAKELGDYLIIGVTNDSFDRERGKLNVRNNVFERVEAVRAPGYADQIIIEDYIGRSDIYLYLEIIKKIIGIGSLCLGVFVGIYGMLCGSIITGLIGFLLNSYYTGRHLNYSSWVQLRE